MKQNLINLILIIAVSEFMDHIGYSLVRVEHWFMILITIALICNNNTAWAFKKKWRKE